jgi:nucleotide-binding universal stress UspA family protein
MDAPLVTGFDGSVAATTAVTVTKRLADGLAEALVVAHSFAPGADIADARAESDELLESIAEAGVRTRSIAGHSAADGLRDIARYEGAAMLAVGRSHYGAIGRALDGVPGKLIHHAPCPVLVVPADASAQFDVIGVAYDGRDESRVALTAAQDIARRLGARLVALSVGVTPPAEDVAEQRTLEGHAGAALVDACADGIDLLVMGSRGRGPVATVAAGSVSRHLADHAPCPVLIVPRAA